MGPRANAVTSSRAVSSAGRLSAALACAALLAAATVIGYRHGGPAIAVAALGVSGLAAISLLLPRR